MKRTTILIASAALLLASASRLNAQNGSEPQQLVISAENVTARAELAAGKPRAGKAVLPGDLMEYRLVFTNTKTIALVNVVFQDPIPAGLQYASGTAQADRQDATVEYSIDRGGSWSAQPLIEVVENGQKVKKPAPAELYTSVRWRVTGPVAPGAKVEARFRTVALGPLQAQSESSVRRSPSPKN